MIARTASALLVALVFVGLALPAPGQGVTDEVLPLLPETPGSQPTADPMAEEEARALIDSIVHPSASAPAGMPRAGDDPYGRLLHAVLARPGMSDLNMQWAIQDYYHEMGFEVPHSPQGGGGTTFTEFDPNSTLTFTYELGDVNGDGFDDIAFNMYCVAYSCRAPGGSFGTQFPPPLQSEGNWCGTPHRLFALNGYNGSVLWESTFAKGKVDINIPFVSNLGNLFSDCALEFVIGTVPDRGINRSALLIYRYDGGPGGIDTIDHMYYLLDPATGEVLWTYEESGTLMWVCIPGVIGCYSPVAQRYVFAEDFLINPLLFIPPTRGVDILDARTQDAFFLQSVGFDYVLMYEQTGEPGTTGRQVWIESYQPAEWVQRLSPLSGAPLWPEPAVTFERNPDILGERSVLPKAMQHPNVAPVNPCVSGYWTYSNYEPYEPCSGYSTPINDPAMLNAKGGNVGAALNQYYRQKPCCYDVTGDGIPDITYTTTEWNAYPSENEEGPFWLDSSVRVFDGSDGSPVHATRVASDEQRFMEEEYFLLGAVGYYIELQPLGNATGGPGADILIHEVLPLENYTRRVRVMDGTTGEIAWTHEGGRAMVALVLGDSDRDGGNDVALFEWDHYQWVQYTLYDFTNVTSTDIFVVRGVDGQVLWQAETFHAPIDLAFMYLSFRNFGLPDVDNDGVGDLMTDDPNYLPDLTVIHRQNYLSGSDGSLLYKIYNVGTFSLPGFAGDLGGGDGHDDFAIISGDIMDLWITVYNGTTGESDWSRRVINPRLAGYVLAVAQYVYHPLGTPNGTGAFMNFNIDVTTFGGFRVANSVYPQLAAFGPRGQDRWEYPEFWSDKVFVIVPGSSPASTAFENLLIEQSRPTGAVGLAVDYGPTSMAGAAMFAAAFGAAFALGNWRYRK